MASSIASQNGGVLLQGDGAVLLQGVKVDAAKDITIQGGIVSMAAATDYTSSSSEHYTRGTKASDGGFDVNVKGHTDLKGGVISSTQAAIDGKKNSFQTASLTTSDIENHSTYKASGCSVSGSVSGALG